MTTRIEVESIRELHAITQRELTPQNVSKVELAKELLLEYVPAMCDALEAQQETETVTVMNVPIMETLQEDREAMAQTIVKLTNNILELTAENNELRMELSRVSRG